MPLDIIKTSNRKPHTRISPRRRNLRSQNKSIADRVKHRRLLAKRSTVSEKTDSKTTTAYGKRDQVEKRRSVTAAKKEEGEDDSEPECPSDEETTVGRGLFGLRRPLDKNSDFYPAVFVEREGNCPLLNRLSWEEAARYNPRDIVWIKHTASKFKTPVDPTLPTYKDYGLKQRFNPRRNMGTPFNQYYGLNRYGQPLMTPQSQGYYAPPTGFPPQGIPPDFPPPQFNTQNPAGHHTAPHPTSMKTPAKQEADDPSKALFHTEEKGVSWRADNLTEEKPSDNDNSHTVSPKKKKKRNKEKKRKMMESVIEEKHEEEEGELIERETTDKKTKYIKNAHGQTKVKVTAPLSIQKKVIASVKEKIEKSENITWEDFASIQGNKDQLSTLIGVVLHKTISYQVNYSNTYPDRVFDYLKYTNKTSLLKALNDESYFYKIVERTAAHNPSSINASMPEHFPQLIGNELTSMIKKENPDAEMVEKGAQLYLHRVYTAEPDKVDDYIESTPIEEILKLAKAPGKLAAAFTKHTGESYSLPYSLDLDLFPSFEWQFKQQLDDESNQKPSVDDDHPKASTKGYGSGNWKLVV
eukprot:scaffold37267_cov41-Cyclotella_meneghiniana.AAC.1